MDSCSDDGFTRAFFLGCNLSQKPHEGNGVPSESSPTQFECEFQGDFKSIGITLDVDDDGRLVLQEVTKTET